MRLLENIKICNQFGYTKWQSEHFDGISWKHSIEKLHSTTKTILTREEFIKVMGVGNMKKLIIFASFMLFLVDEGDGLGGRRIPSPPGS